MKKISILMFVLLLFISIPITFTSAFASSDNPKTSKTSKINANSTSDSNDTVASNNTTQNDTNKLAQTSSNHDTDAKADQTTAPTTVPIKTKNNNQTKTDENTSPTNTTDLVQTTVATTVPIETKNNDQTKTDENTSPANTISDNQDESVCGVDSTKVTFEPNGHTNNVDSSKLTIPGGTLAVNSTCPNGGVNFVNFYNFKYSELYTDVTNTQTIIKHVLVFDTPSKAIKIYHQRRILASNSLPVSQNTDIQNNQNNYPQSLDTQNDTRVLGSNASRSNHNFPVSTGRFPLSQNSIAMFLTSIGSILLMAIRRSMHFPF